MYTKNTKVVCTLGPSTDSVKEIVDLIHAGMNVARLNFSHGDHDSHKKLVKNIKRAEKITGKTIAILQDLQGPKIRIGEMPKEGIKVEKNQIIKITIRKIVGNEDEDETIIPIKYAGITKDVKKNHIVLINDGLIETTVLKVTKTEITCHVRFGGIIKTGNGVNLPTSKVTIPTITEKDKNDLKLGMKFDVDFVALSFVKNRKDIIDLRELIEKAGRKAHIVAKIERHEAVTNLREIIKASDAVMVARGDLGTDIPAEQVPIIQKRIITLSNKYGKPVITATQVLQSMVKNSKATRAEISDAANAVFDHTDAIMLSNETAVGKYPTKATTTLTKVASAVEKELQKHEELVEYTLHKGRLNQINATCLNACEIATDTNATYIAIYTEDGYTARNIAKHRLFTPIITITPNKKTARQLALVWGINTVFIHKCSNDNTRKAEEIMKILKNNKLAKKNNKIVIVSNSSKKEGFISTLKI